MEVALSFVTCRADAFGGQTPVGKNSACSALDNWPPEHMTESSEGILVIWHFKNLGFYIRKAEVKGGPSVT